MKPIPFPSNDHGMMFEYHRMREGPNYFMCHYKQTSVLRKDPKDAWRILGAAKFTDTGKILKEWCLDMHDTYVVQKQAETDEGRKDTSFASEVQSEHEEPNDNTKTII